MRVLLAPDKFKGSLTAGEVIAALSKGIYSVIPDATLHPIQASDGGDGFLDAVSHYRKTELIITSCEDPLGREIKAPFRVDPQAGEAYIEMAQAAGLVLLEPEERSATRTSSRGTGMQIREALKMGCHSIFIGLGGSATNDGGTGMAEALGFRFLDARGDQLLPTGQNLSRIQAIEYSGMLPEARKARFTAVNDVNNPLYGPNGAAHIYAAQKGATQEEIELLDHGLQHLDDVVQQQLGKSHANEAGSGAAGGAAFGLKSFLNAQFISGTQFILELAQVPALLKKEKIDYILTGEGKIDHQTLSGKWINGLAELGKQHDIPIIAVCGLLEVPSTVLKENGVQHVIEVRDKSQPLEYNMKNAAALVETAIAKFFRSLG